MAITKKKETFGIFAKAMLYNFTCLYSSSGFGKEQLAIKMVLNRLPKEAELEVGLTSSDEAFEDKESTNSDDNSESDYTKSQNRDWNVNERGTEGVPYLLGRIFGAFWYRGFPKGRLASTSGEETVLL